MKDSEVLGKYTAPDPAAPVRESELTAAYRSFERLKTELSAAYQRIDELETALASIQAVVNRQADDEGLWRVDPTCGEAYVQSELRILHAAIESRVVTLEPFPGNTP